MIKPAPDAPLCFCSRVTCEWGWKGPVGGKDLEATVSCAYNGFVYHAQARWVGFKFDQGGPPASIENDDVAANFDGVGAIGRGGDRARRGEKKCGPRTQLCSGFAKIVASMRFGNSGVNQDQTIHAGRGHKGKEFSMFEAVESVDIEVNYPEVRFKPRIAVLIEFECLWVEVEEIKEGRGPERVAVLRRLSRRGGGRVVRSETCRNRGVALKRAVSGTRGAMNIATGVD